MLHWPTGPSILSLINLSCISQERLPELGLSSSRTPYSPENFTQATHNFNHTMKTEPSSSHLWPHLSWVQRQTSTAHRWCLPVIFALIIQRGLYLTGLYWKVKGWFMSCCLGAVLPGTQRCAAAVPPSRLLFSHLVFSRHVPDAKSRRETSFLPALFCSENILLGVASCPTQL